ncbi:MAG: flagellar basal body-associated FliL family protein [Alphaproteobacteria bacterium]|nr:flagellar basal body-associated FliL family protein [Alphaproteobacteria bacterium]
MDHQAEKTRLIRFYAGSAALIIVLAILGFLYAGNVISSGSAPTTVRRSGAPEMSYIGLPRVNVAFSGPFAMQMQLDLTLEVEPRYAMIVEGYVPKVMDRLNAYFPRAKLDDLDRPHAMFLLRKEMLWEVNNIGIPVPVNDVLIQNMYMR